MDIIFHWKKARASTRLRKHIEKHPNDRAAKIKLSVLEKTTKLDWMFD